VRWALDSDSSRTGAIGVTLQAGELLIFLYAEKPGKMAQEVELFT